MTDQEKEESPNYKTTEGFLRVYKYKEAFKTAFDKADIEGIKQTLELPNFDYKIFEEISGISKSDFDKRLGKPSCYDHNNKSYTYCPHCGNKMEE